VKHWKVIVAAALIFATGAATGAFGYRTLNRASQKSRDPGGPPPMMDRRFDFLGRLKKDLNLSEEQASKIDVVLQEGSKRTRKLWETVQPQMQEEMKRVTERIKSELTPEQRTQFDEQSKRFRERRGPRPQGTNAPGEGYRRGPRPPGPAHGPPHETPADSAAQNPQTPAATNRPAPAVAPVP